jgi:hypothetical protein
MPPDAKANADRSPAFADGISGGKVRRAHPAMGGTEACFEIAERPPADSSNISVRMIRNV